MSDPVIEENEYPPLNWLERDPVIEDNEYPPLNWLECLEDLVKNPNIEDDEHVDLCGRAADWPTCACGQLCEKLPRGSDGSPIDWGLRECGLRFSVAINGKKWKKALDLFHKIEARTATLLIHEIETTNQQNNDRRPD